MADFGMRKRPSLSLWPDSNQILSSSALDSSTLISPSSICNPARRRYPKGYTHFSWQVLLVNCIISTASFFVRIFRLDVPLFPRKRLLAAVSALPKTILLGNTYEADAGYRLLINELARCKHLSGYGRLVYTQYILYALDGRQDFINYINEHPEISDVDIGMPLIITGLHRTCSTLLHRLLALDPACRTTTAFDTYPISGFPLMPPVTQEERLRHPRALQWQNHTLPAWKNHAPEQYRMMMRNHRFDPFEPEVCISETLVLAERPEEFFLYQQHGVFPLQSVLLDTIANGTASEEHPPTSKNSYTEWCLDEKCQEDAVLLIKRYIQAFHAAWPPISHWCLKAPQHALYPGALDQHFPNARYIIAHRDPLMAVPSAARLMADVLIANVQSETLDLHGVGKSMLRQSALKLQRLNEFRQRIRASDPPREHAQFFDVKFDDVASDPVSTIRTIYSHFGLNFSPEYELSMIEWLRQDKARRKDELHGGGMSLKPPLEMEDFGLTVEQIVDKFAPEEFDKPPIEVAFVQGA